MADGEHSTSSSVSPPATDGAGSEMGQCGVTQKWFPLADLVVFQGKLVCAEGKQILLDRLKTGAFAPEELARPSALRRFACIFIDWLIILPVWYLFLVMVVVWVVVPFHLFTGAPAVVTLVFGTLSVLAFAYFAILHGTSGKSVGKRVGRTRVVTLGGVRASWGKILLRSALYPGTIAVIGVACLLPDPDPGNMGFRAILGALVLLVMAWILADALAALFDPIMQRSLHDRISGTRVIWERS